MSQTYIECDKCQMLFETQEQVDKHQITPECAGYLANQNERQESSQEEKEMQNSSKEDLQATQKDLEQIKESKKDPKRRVSQLNQIEQAFQSNRSTRNKLSKTFDSKNKEQNFQEALDKYQKQLNQSARQDNKNTNKSQFLFANLFSEISKQGQKPQNMSKQIKVQKQQENESKQQNVNYSKYIDQKKNFITNDFSINKFQTKLEEQKIKEEYLYDLKLKEKLENQLRLKQEIALLDQKLNGNLQKFPDIQTQKNDFKAKLETLNSQLANDVRKLPQVNLNKSMEIQQKKIETQNYSQRPDYSNQYQQPYF